jgi:hypothetical protein
MHAGSRVNKFLLIFSVLLVSQVLFAGSEKLTPTQQVSEYLRLLNSKNSHLDAETRQATIEKFAELITPLSPRYGKGVLRINEQQWVDVLLDGFKKAPKNRTMVLSLTRLLINTKQYSKALEVITPYQKTNPCHESTAWLWYAKSEIEKRKSQTVSKNENVPVFDVHFCIITSNPKAHRKATLKQLRREIMILNKMFVTMRKKPIVRFRFKSASLYSEIKSSKDEFVKVGDSREKYDTNKYAQLFNACADKKVRDKKAINFYVYDSYNSTTKYKDVTSHGKRNSNWPYVLIDWQRLNNNIQSPEAHEMGHAFGLYHVAVPGAKLKSPTNIMASTQGGFGSGGKRNIGFTEAQKAIIIYHAKRTLARFSKEQ